MKKFYDSDEFKTAAKQAEPFLKLTRDFVFGRIASDLTLQNVVSAPLGG